MTGMMTRMPYICLNFSIYPLMILYTFALDLCVTRTIPRETNFCTRFIFKVHFEVCYAEKEPPSTFVDTYVYIWNI